MIIALYMIEALVKAFSDTLRNITYFIDHRLSNPFLSMYGHKRISYIASRLKKETLNKLV